MKLNNRKLCNHKYCRSSPHNHSHCPFCWMGNSLGNMGRFALPQLCGSPYTRLLWISTVKKAPHCAHSTQKVRGSGVCRSRMVSDVNVSKYCQAAPLFQSALCFLKSLNYTISWSSFHFIMFITTEVSFSREETVILWLDVKNKNKKYTYIHTRTLNYDATSPHTPTPSQHINTAVNFQQCSHCGGELDYCSASEDSSSTVLQ